MDINTAPADKIADVLDRGTQRIYNWIYALLLAGATYLLARFAGVVDVVEGVLNLFTDPENPIIINPALVAGAVLIFVRDKLEIHILQLRTKISQVAAGLFPDAWIGPRYLQRVNELISLDEDHTDRPALSEINPIGDLLGRIRGREENPSSSLGDPLGK